MTQSKTNMPLPVETTQTFQIEICEVIKKKKEVEIIFQLKYETLSQIFQKNFRELFQLYIPEYIQNLVFVNYYLRSPPANCIGTAENGTGLLGECSVNVFLYTPRAMLGFSDVLSCLKNTD